MDLSLKFQADLDQQALVKKINIMLVQLRKSLGEFGKGVTILDEKSIKQQFEGVNKQFQTMATQSGAAKRGLEQVGASLEQAANKGSLLGKAFQFNMVTQAVTQVTSAFNQFLVPYQEFDKQLKNIGTLGVKNFEEFKTAAIDLASGVPDTVAGVTEGIYNAISAGAIEVVDGQANIAQGMKFVEQASKLAVAGMTDTNAAIKGLASVTNAYGTDVLSAGDAADYLFAAVKNGVTTVPELNASLSNVVPIAAAAGVSFEEVAAGIATLTKQGVPTAQATTQMRAAIAELLKPGASLKKVMTEAGVSIETLRNEGLQVTMAKLGQSMNSMGTDAANTFSSIEAVGFALASTGDNADKFKNDLLAIEAGAGSVEEAFNVASDGIANKTQGMMNQIEAMFFKFFDGLGETGTTVLSVTTQMAPMVATFAGLGQVLPDLGGAIKKHWVTSMQGATKAQKALNFAMMSNPAVASIAAILALGLALRGLSDWLNTTAKERLEDGKAELEFADVQLQAAKNRMDLQQKQIKSGEALIKAFEDEGEAALNNSDMLLQLEKAYPGAIDKTVGFTQNLARLKMASLNSKTELQDLKGEISELALAKVNLEIDVARLETNAIKEGLEDQLTEALVDDKSWLNPLGKVGLLLGEKIFGTSSVRWQAEAQMKEYTDAIYNASTSEELQRAGNELQMAITKGTGEFATLDPKEKAKMMNDVQQMVDSELKIRELKAKKIENWTKQQIDLGMKEADIIAMGKTQFELTEKEVKDLIEQQKKSKAEQDKTTQAVQATTASASDLAKQFGEVFAKAKEQQSNAVGALAELRRQYRQGEIDATAFEQKRQELIQEGKQATKEVLQFEKDRKLSEKEIGMNVEKTNKEVKKSIDLAKEIYDLGKKRLDNELKQFTINSDLARLQEGREKSLVDEIAGAKEKKRILEEQKKLLIETYQLQLDADGNIVDMNVSVAKQDRQKTLDGLKQDLLDLNMSIQESEVANLELQAKIKLNQVDLDKQLKELELKRIEFEVSIGVKTEKDLLALTQKDLNGVQKAIQEVQSAMNALQDSGQAEKGAKELTQEEIIQLQEFQKKLYELKSEEVDLLKTSEDKKRSIRQKAFDELKTQNDKDLSEIERRVTAENELTKSVMATVVEALSRKTDRTKDDELAKLESKREAEIISEAAFKKEKERIEAEHQRTLRNMQEAQRAAEMEAERRQTALILEEKMKRAQAELAQLDPEKDADQYRQVFDQINTLNKELAEKTDLLTAYGAEMSGAIGDIFANMFAGDNEAMKNSVKDSFSFVAGVLKKSASATVTKLVLESLFAGGGGIFGLLATPAITALINAAISKILDPVLSSITSFSTGGRVDEPTLAIVGDASRSRAGRDTEWIFRDDQLRLIMAFVLAKHQAGLERSLSNIIGVEMRRDDNSPLTQLNNSIRQLNTSLNRLPKDLRETITFDKAFGMYNETMKINALNTQYKAGQLDDEDYYTRLAEKQMSFRSYAGGSGFLYQPELAMVGDAGVNNPEIVLNNPQLEALITKVGNQSNAAVVSKLDKVESLLSQILDKDQDIYLNSSKVTDEVQREFNRRKFRNP
ncbi:MAG: phage tail tape measure protein [Candidatus Kapabacteria bacterium]|nr:phage tail tape measure protein [Ignavibacteriota bacterium]MCW5885248.1 phage tail tape measure protein [Candidatus Kapabacteria bacterium]